MLSFQAQAQAFFKKLRQADARLGGFCLGFAIQLIVDLHRGLNDNKVGFERILSSLEHLADATQGLPNGLKVDLTPSRIPCYFPRNSYSMIKVLDIDYGNGRVSRKKIQKAMAALWARKIAAQSSGNQSGQEVTDSPLKSRKSKKAAVTVGA